jgi:Uma2 family endonuclease
MSSAAVKLRPATLDDLLAIPEAERFHEIIDGELVRKAMPSFRHGGAQFELSGLLGGPYGHRGRGGPGGWRFANEVEIVFATTQVFRPDVAGWRRERLPAIPNEFPFTVRPDWVCEILSPSNPENDLFKKIRVYQRAQVPHYWIIDPAAETLAVYRWTPDGFLLVTVSKGEERVRAEPFDAVELSVRELVVGGDGDEGDGEGGGK